MTMLAKPTVKPTFSLSDLIVPMLAVWLLAWFLALMTAISVVGLLVTSGWFISMAGLSGLVAGYALNYVLPSSVIRALAIGRTVGRYGDLMVSHYAIFELLKRLRVQFFESFSVCLPSERAKIGSGAAQHRLVKDIDTLDEFALRVVSPWVVVPIVLLVACVLLFFGLGQQSATVSAMVFGLLLVLLFLFAKNAKPFVAVSTQLQETRQIALTTAMPALTQLTLWGKWQATMDEMAEIDGRLGRLHKQQSRYNQLAAFMSQGMLIVLLLFVIYQGAMALDGGRSDLVPVLLAVVFGFFGLMEVVSALSVDVAAFARASLAKDRLNAIVGKQVSQKRLDIPEVFDICLTNVSVYHQGAVFGLDGVNATIRQGVPFVILGASGVGKSTLLQALAGELSPKAGNLTLKVGRQDVPMHDFDWQGQLGFLGQQVDIFDQSLADNLRLGKAQASDEELWQVLDLVGLKAWADQQPDKLNAPLGEYGLFVSGGQARRIALARLLLSPKKILLLDEPFAGLDKGNQERLWQALQTWQQDKILVVVSHHDLQGAYDKLVVG